VRAQQNRFDALGLRAQLWTYTSGDHFLQSIQDQWQPAADFLGSPKVVGDPSRVDYAFLPQADSPDFGLRADHAYWVSGLRARNTSGDPQTAPARALITARSLAFGQGAPVTRSFREPAPQTASPSPSLIEGTDWTRTRRATKRNALHLSLTNVSAAKADGAAARLSGAKPLRVRIGSDGLATIELAIAVPRRPSVRIIGGPAAGWRAQVANDHIIFTVGRGTRTFLIRSR